MSSTLGQFPTIRGIIWSSTWEVRHFGGVRLSVSVFEFSARLRALVRVELRCNVLPGKRIALLGCALGSEAVDASCPRDVVSCELTRGRRRAYRLETDLVPSRSAGAQVSNTFPSRCLRHRLLKHSSQPPD